MPSAELVIFAIRAGLRLGQEARRTYIDQTRQRALVLPLPEVSLRPTVGSANRFFRGDGAAFVADADSKIADLAQRAGTGDLTRDEEHDYLQRYHELFRILVARQRDQPANLADDTPLSPAEFNALLTIRQWQVTDPHHPRPVQRFIGSLIEIGIDYFRHVPGALDPRSRHGRTLTGFVDALDEVDFTEILLGDAVLEHLIGRLLIAAAETIADQPEFITGDPALQRLVAVTTRDLTADIAGRLSDLSDDLGLQDRFLDWSELVFSSLLASAGRDVLAHPALYLGVDDEASGALVTGVGTALIDLAMIDETIDFGRVFSRTGLDALIKSSLAVVGRHPELIADTDNAGLTGLVADVAADLAGRDDPLALDMLPELARVLIEKTARNLPLIWPDLDPQQHLLLTAGRTVLDVLAAPPPRGSRWRLQFSHDDLLNVIDAVTDELIDNPAWLLAAAEDAHESLRIALAETLAVLRKRGDQRLHPSMAVDVLLEVASALSRRREFIESIVGDRPVVAGVIDAILQPVFNARLDPAVQWQLVRGELLDALIALTLDRFADSSMDDDALKQLKRAMKGLVDDVKAGRSVDLDSFDRRLLVLLADEDVVEDPT